MTTLLTERVHCGVCRKSSEHQVIGSTNTFGGCPDLDGRPPEMMRSTMGLWLQRCPYCGYIAESIADKTTVGRRWLKSDDFLGTDEAFTHEEIMEACPVQPIRPEGGVRSRLPWRRARHADAVPASDYFAGSHASGNKILAVWFYLYHKIALHDEDVKAAALALLHAAWACDDEGDAEKARMMRRKCAALLDDVISASPADADLELTLVDVLRRAGMFDRVIGDFYEGMFDDADQNAIVAFQIARARARDDGSYRTDQIDCFDNLPDADEAEADMMVGSYVVEVRESKVSAAGACVDVSAFFADGQEIVVTDSWFASDQCVSLWHKDQASTEVAELEAALASEIEFFDFDLIRSQLSSLRSAQIVRIDGGVLCLSARLMSSLGVCVGDNCALLGCYDHVEIWNHLRWEEESTSLSDELSSLFDALDVGI